MRTTLLSILFISLLTTSCKKEEVVVAPDLSKNFVGVYRAITKPATNKEYESQLTVIKKDITKISITLIETLKSYDSNKKLIDTEVYSSEFKDVLLKDESNFEINEIVTRTRQSPIQSQKYQMTGNGILTGKSLTVILKYDGQTGTQTLVRD
jgi:hypothetical protein